MAERIADLSKQERIEKAVAKCLRDRGFSARKAAQIYKIAPFIITRQLNEQARPKKFINQSK
jgi:endonuclease III